MPDYLKYQKSIGREFKAFENRVRHLIDDSHWGEEGKYKEVILMNYLRRILPNNISVGTGFVRNQNLITKQIDIIIYDNSYPVLFSEGDFIITTPDNVLGIVEVKSKVTVGNLFEIMSTAQENAQIIEKNLNRIIFNGIFSYQAASSNIGSYYQKLSINDINMGGLVNHVALGDRFFIKLWEAEARNESPHASYRFYKLPEDLTVPYFLSNLQEHILKQTNNNFANQRSEFLYPILEGKETHLQNTLSIPRKN